MNNEAIKIVHAIPGRVRLKVPKIRKNSAFEAEIRDRLSTAKAIQRVEINPITGSVLLLYNPEEIRLPGPLFSLWKSFSSLFPDLNFEEIRSCLVSSNSPSTPTSSSSASASSADPTVSRILELSRTANERLKKAGSPDIKVLLPMTLLTLGVRGLLIAENVPFPAWYDFLWFSFSTFFILNPRKDH
jgi:hypothetical protein